MTNRLSGKCAVITGGGRGIGKSIALTFAQEGARCVITSRHIEDLVATAAEAPEGSLIPLACDVGDSDSVEGMAKIALKELGKVDIVVNNAGVHAAGKFVDIDPEVYLDLYNVNVVGTVRISQAFIPSMIGIVRSD